MENFRHPYSKIDWLYFVVWSVLWMTVWRREFDFLEE